MTRAHEVNFDGLVGPTHNYAGLSFGNIASQKHKQTISHPRDAALQGLAKMKFMFDLGLTQGILPPHERPHLPTLRRLGFTGTDAQILEKVQRENPTLLAGVCSSSAMWAANAAVVSPSADTVDGRVHFTAANLITTFHRSIETRTTAAILKKIFPDERHFAHHDPLPASTAFSDEGAANHMRLASSHGDPGIEVFTFGRSAWDSKLPAPTRFPARQTKEASAALASLHCLRSSVLVQQNPVAIDAGAFHNDVVAVANLNVLLCHERAFLHPLELDFPNLRVIRIPEAQVPLDDAISSYLFNSQLVTLRNGSMSLIAPVEANENSRVRAAIEEIIAADNPISAVHYVDVRQSMQNGGGPACLRLRVVLTDEELGATHQGVLFTDALYEQLRGWIVRNYRAELGANDLADPKLLDESRRALDELTRLLQLGAVYEFQRA